MMSFLMMLPVTETYVSLWRVWTRWRIVVPEGETLVLKWLTVQWMGLSEGLYLWFVL